MKINYDDTNIIIPFDKLETGTVFIDEDNEVMMKVQLASSIVKEYYTLNLEDGKLYAIEALPNYTIKQVLPNANLNLE